VAGNGRDRVPKVTVTPFVGLVKRDRLGSMVGVHALHEKAVTKACSADNVGLAIKEAIHDIVVMETKYRRNPELVRVVELQFIVQFRE
jgi:hypothetical protein